MWRSWSLLSAAAFCFALAPSALGACPGGTVSFGKQVCGKKIIFEDLFTGKDIYANWKHVVRFSTHPDYEFNYYDRSRKNLFLQNGTLHLMPSLLLTEKAPETFLYTGKLNLNDYPPKASHCTLRPDSGLCEKTASGYQILPPVVSARITSKIRFRYGSVEIRAKIPQGDWIYPQIELAPPAGWSRYGKESGVIVIALVRGNEELKMRDYDDRLNFGVNWLEAGVFAGTYSPQTTPTVLAALNKDGWHDHFHTFRVDWLPGKLTFWVDGELIGKGVVATSGLLPQPPHSKTAPVDEELEVALGVGVGGVQRFPDGVLSNGRPKPWRNNSPKASLQFWKAKDKWLPTWRGQDSALQVDWVKVWSLSTNATTSG